MILKGDSSNAIASVLGISLPTVKNHRRNIYAKLQISSQVELFSLLVQKVMEPSSWPSPPYHPLGWYLFLKIHEILTSESKLTLRSAGQKWGGSVFPIADIRALLPALSQTDGGQDRIHLDSPAGTQVAAAVADYVLADASTMGGHFTTNLRTDEVVLKAHQDAAVFLGAASAREIIIVQSMTSLTFHLSRSICRDFRSGDEIIISTAKNG